MIELAAVAAGHTGYIYEWVNGPTFVVPANPEIPRSEPVIYDWVNDDGDSRRLQVVLLIDLDFYDDRANAYAWNQLWCVEASEPLGTDPAAAARMAVLRVAAQMGAAMKEQGK